jgi:hypothetical protein
LKISKKFAMFVIAAAAVSAIGIVTTLDAVQVVHAAPQSRHGTCFTNEVNACAGNAGGFVDTPNKDCREINNGPFNTHIHDCP